MVEICNYHTYSYFRECHVHTCSWIIISHHPPSPTSHSTTIPAHIPSHPTNPHPPTHSFPPTSHLTHIPPHPIPNPSQPWRMGGSHVAAGRETLKQGMTFPRPFLSSSFSFGVERGRELWESEALAIFSLELFLSMHCCLECRVARELTHACLECRFESERMHACTLLLHACIFELHAWVERILLHKFRVWKVYDI